MTANNTAENTALNLLNKTDTTQTISAQTLPLYAFLFVLANSAFNNCNACENNVIDKTKILKDFRNTDYLNKISCSEEIKSFLNEYAYIPEGFTKSSFYNLKPDDIKNLFLNTQPSSDKSSGTCSNMDMYQSALKLLTTFSKGESICDLYSSFNYINQQKLQSPVPIVFYERNFTNYIFIKLKAALLNPEKELPLEYLNLNLDLPLEELLQNNKMAGKFSMLYAFPPVFQKKREATKGYERYFENAERSETDNTEKYISFAIDCLTDDGCAVILVSDAFFTRKYKDLRNYIYEQKLIKCVINFSEGCIIPPHISSSMLIIKKKPEYSFFKYKTRLPADGLTDDIIKQLLSKQEDFVDVVSYNLNNKSNSNQGVAESTLDYRQNRPYTLENEAEIFKPTLSKIIKNAKEGVHLLKISDITDNLISENLEELENLDGRSEEDILGHNDIVISKVLPPKIAICRFDTPVIPADNFFIIRIKPSSALHPYYLKNYLESEEGQALLYNAAKGGSLHFLNKEILKQLKIPYKNKTDQIAIEQKYKEIESQIYQLQKQIQEKKEEIKNLLK